MKLLVYSDGGPSSRQALLFAAQLTRKLEADLAVITVRAGTHAIEPLPPFGQEVDLADRQHLPSGLQVLAQALDALCDDGLIDRQDSRKILIRELPNGHLFVCQSRTGSRIPFYGCFGPMIETLNQEIDAQRYDLMIIAPPPRGRLHKIVLGDTTRKLVLDVHTSVLFVREGRPDSRFVVCVDGSTAARRQLGMLKRLLPVITPPLELIWVRTPQCDAAEAQAAERYLRNVEKWLTAAGRPYKIHRMEGARPDETIASAVEDDAVIFLGASLRHDIYRRLMGSLPIQILARTRSSVLLVKGLPEGDPEVLLD
jgi:nucleotide-binding universal stress UspA family protein